MIPLGPAWRRLLWRQSHEATDLLRAISRAYEAQWMNASDLDHEHIYVTRHEEEEALNRLVELWAKEELVRWHTRLSRRGFPRMDPHDARAWFPVECVDKV